MMPTALWLCTLGQFDCDALPERKSCRAFPGFVSGKTHKLNEGNGSMEQLHSAGPGMSFGTDYLQAALVAVSICGRGECEGVV